LLLAGFLLLAAQSMLLHGQGKPGEDESKIDYPLELHVGEPLEHLQTKIGANQPGQRICGRFCVEHATLADKAQYGKRRDLKDEDVRLIDRALDDLVPSSHAAPNGDECSGKGRQRPSDPAERSDADVRQHAAALE